MEPKPDLDPTSSPLNEFLNHLSRVSVEELRASIGHPFKLKVDSRPGMVQALDSLNSIKQKAEDKAQML